MFDSRLRPLQLPAQCRHMRMPKPKPKPEADARMIEPGCCSAVRRMDQSANRLDHSVSLFCLFFSPFAWKTALRSSRLGPLHSSILPCPSIHTSISRSSAHLSAFKSANIKVAQTSTKIKRRIPALSTPTFPAPNIPTTPISPSSDPYVHVRLGNELNACLLADSLSTILSKQAIRFDCISSRSAFSSIPTAHHTARTTSHGRPPHHAHAHAHKLEQMPRARTWPTPLAGTTTRLHLFPRPTTATPRAAAAAKRVRAAAGRPRACGATGMRCTSSCSRQSTMTRPRAASAAP